MVSPELVCSYSTSYPTQCTQVAIVLTYLVGSITVISPSFTPVNMFWNFIPSTLKNKIIEEVIHLKYVNKQGEFDSGFWERTLENCRLVSGKSPCFSLH